MHIWTYTTRDESAHHEEIVPSVGLKWVEEDRQTSSSALFGGVRCMRWKDPRKYHSHLVLPANTCYVMITTFHSSYDRLQHQEWRAVKLKRTASKSKSCIMD